ncbi:MAG: hypothetical protein NT133_21920 [Alphaproteobacteria bacterium]|nr:hypothetical protein [Alphaproteobacteria bacterium]
MPELTPSTREAARRIGVTDTALRKAVANGRIAREPDGQWDVEKTRRRMVETADPVRSPLAGGGAGGAMSGDATPYARLKVAQLALKVEAQRMALDEDKGRLLDAQTANAAIDEIAGAMRDALLNWPARVSGLIAADLGADPHLVQTVLQQHITDLLTEAANRFDPPGIGGRADD